MPSIFLNCENYMKVKIESDVFDITKRIKDIDEGYYIVFDTNKEVYELHCKNQFNSFCLTVPYDVLDDRLLDFINYTDIRNIDNIINDIDINNNEIEKNNNLTFKDKADYMLREIYSFANNSSKQYNENSFLDVWR